MKIKITDDGIRNLTNLTSLNLTGNKKITDEGIKLSQLSYTNNEIKMKK